jgi:hypothetical protein
MIRGMVNRAKNVGEEFVEEVGIEGPGIQTAAGGLSTYIKPEKNNLLMGTADPNDPGFDQRVIAESANQRGRQIEAANEYAAAVGKDRKPAKPTNHWLPSMLLTR